MSEKLETAIFLIIFLGTFILFAFIPMGITIFMLTSFPIMLSRQNRISNVAVDISFLIIFLAMFFGAYYNNFELDFEQTLFVFCPLVGYLLNAYHRNK
jgi:hypothetical protein